MICFAWGGFPQYAARLVGAFVKAIENGDVPELKGERIVVAAKPPAVPVLGMEKYTNCEIKWVQPEEKTSLKNLFGEIPGVLIVSGWNFPAFNRFREEVLSNSGRAIVICDNNFELKDSFVGRMCDYRQWPAWLIEYMKKIRFLLLLKKKFSGFLVPGKSGIRLLRYYGVDGENVESGLYSADNSIFYCDKPILSRPKRFIYVGQYVERKNVLRLCRAFAKSEKKIGAGWQLHLYGCGPLKESLSILARESNGSIVVHDFVQPEQLRDLYQGSRVFCLPSENEHWGLVVHEATLCGCLVLLGNRVGAAEDLLGEKNGIGINPRSESSIAYGIEKMMCMSESEAEKGSLQSLKLAQGVSFANFVRGVKNLILKGYVTSKCS